MWNVVTGCSGFIGGHLVRALLARGQSVCGVDIRPSPEIEQLQEVYEDRIQVIWGDLVDEDVCRKAVEGVNTVYHLAAETDLKKSVESPTQSLSDDLITTVNILHACAKSGFYPRVVIASSAAVYGKSGLTPATEQEALAAVSLSPYAVHKRACEMYADMYQRLYPLSTVCLRYFNVYGPGQMNLQAAVPSLTLGILRGQPVSIRGGRPAKQGLRSR